MRTTMNLGESINTYDPAEALRDEVGTFRVKVPAGCELVLTHKSNGEMRLGWKNPAPPTQQEPFLITKISEPAHAETVPITKIA
ncbi:MAG TPA: hypothetical protein VFO27_11430 [Bryobacteraceae bacterium]|nr:hypothetical protein [Bryobacteraceae bacterium]